MASKESSKALPWGLNKDGLAPGSMKTISESKLKAFDVGLMNSSVKKTTKTKQDMEEKKKAEEEACAEVYADFLASFESSAATTKAFVKGSTINPDKKAVVAKSTTAYPSKSIEGKFSTAYPSKFGGPASSGGQIYKPVSRFNPLPTPADIKAKLEKSEVTKKKKAEKEKKKSNLELFKEELKRQQEEREIRHKLKKEIGQSQGFPEDFLRKMTDGDLSSSFGSFDVGDPNTTNLYIGNISPKMNEEMLMKLFGKYGPLASVKIMWPRTEEEKSRNRNCGFVAYMLRKDGEKALKSLNGKMIMDFEMKLGWGKSVPIPPHPIYIPPDLQEASKPPPPSGLPFNAQIVHPSPDDETKDPNKLDANGFNVETLANAVVKVVIPQERNVLCLIHRMIEFVVREGPMFEAMIMNREIKNPLYRFLFDNQSCEHIYYRWKLFSILQGDSPTKWQTEDFLMFGGGSIWHPPHCSQYSYYRAQSSDEPEAPRQREAPVPSKDQPPQTSSQSSSTSSSSSKRGNLSSRQRDKLEDTLRGLTLERPKVADAMLWCLEHADAAEEIVECIAESLSLIETPPVSKVARLYLVSDILHNCSAKVPNASFFRRGFEAKLVEIMTNVGETFRAIKGRMRAETFKKQVLRCLTAWIDWAIYPMDYLINLQNIFMGEQSKTVGSSVGMERSHRMDFLDGVPLDSSDLDGVPMGSDLDGTPLDGIPMKDDDIDGAPMEDFSTAPVKRETKGVFMASRWETADQEEQQTSRLSSTETLKSPDEKSEQSKGSSKPLSVDVDEIKRKKLREIEIKVAEFSERLEAMGAAKSGINIKEECDKYRTQLLEEAAPKKDKRRKEKDGSRSSSPTSRHDRRKRSRSRSPSGHRTRRSRSRSGSPSARQSNDSDSPLATSLLSLKGYNSRSPSPSKGQGESRDKARSRSRSPDDKRKRRSRSPPSARSRKRSRSRSKSPKNKKNKRRSRSRSPVKGSKASSSKKSKR